MFFIKTRLIRLGWKIDILMGTLLLGTILLASSFIFACSKSPTDLDEKSVMNETVLAKAGPGYTNPNTFSVSGILTIKGGDNNTQAIGTPMELYMGADRKVGGTLVGHVTFLSGPSRVRINLTDVDGIPGPDMFPYVATEVHIHFARTIDGIPHTKKGIPFRVSSNTTNPLYQVAY